MQKAEKSVKKPISNVEKGIIKAITDKTHLRFPKFAPQGVNNIQN